MKYKLLLLLILNTIFLNAQVIREAKSVIEFTDLGNYTVEESHFITATEKKVDEETQFKGKGFLKGTLAKLILKSGKNSELIQPLQKRFVYIDHKDKSYFINKYDDFSFKEMADSLKNIDMSDYEPTEVDYDSLENIRYSDPDFEILASDFVITKTGNSKKINNFECDEYTINWYTKWRIISTEETGTDSLFTTTWTTPYSNEIKNCIREEAKFSEAMLGSMDMDIEIQEMQRRAVFGFEWMAVFSQLGQNNENASSNLKYKEIADEMQKLEGYPIVIDGAYFAKRSHLEKKEEAENTSIKSIDDAKGALGGFMKKKMFGKKKPKGPKPIFTYFTEVKKYEQKNIDSKTFEIPENYKERDEKNK